MSKIKTITVTATEQAVAFDATYQFVWFRSLGDVDVLVSDHSGIVEGTDDVALVKGGDSTRITIPYNKTVYAKAVSDSVDMEIHAQNFSDAPFEGGSGGGGSGGAPDTYLKTAAIGNDGSLTLTKQDNTTVSLTLDATPTENSTHAVTSGGVYAVLQGVSPINYSTTEQDTGRKWIDGKPIYQKTYVKTAMGEYPNELPANCELIINAYSVIHYTAGDDIIIPVYATGSSDYYNFYFKNTSLVLRDPTGTITNIRAVITIQYTKTTDTAE